MEQVTLKQAIEKLGLSMIVQRIPVRYNIPMDEELNTFNHWLFEIRREGRGRSLWGEYSHVSPVEPEIAEVLNSVLVDTIEFPLEFEQWCKSHELSTDSRLAFATYCIIDGYRRDLTDRLSEEEFEMLQGSELL